MSRRLLLPGAAALALIAGIITVTPAAEASAPPVPSGWNRIFLDDFTGPANTGVNTSNWLYDIGTGYPGGAPNWGTGEIETMTNSTQNVYQDGAGNLVIKPIEDKSVLSQQMAALTADIRAPGGVEGTGPVLIVEHTTDSALVTFRTS